MIRASTPTHYFDLHTDASQLAKILITYEQGGEIVLEKEKDDLTISDHVVSFKLTQLETKEFNAGSVNIQVRIKTADGTVMCSRIITKRVSEVLNDEVL